MRNYWMLAVALALVIALPGMARAAEQECRANLNGVEVGIRYDRKAEVYSSFREKRLMRRKTYPGGVVIAYMMPGLVEAERAMICAVYDKKTDHYRTVAEGERDAYGRCKKPESRACRIVNATKDEAREIGAIGVNPAARGVTAAKNKAGSAAAAAVAAPGVLAGAAVSVVVVGGAVYVCG